MMKKHRYSNGIKSIRLQTSLYDSVAQSAILSRMAHNLKLISSIPIKKSAFCMKTSYFMNK